MLLKAKTKSNFIMLYLKSLKSIIQMLLFNSSCLRLIMLGSFACEYILILMFKLLILMFKLLISMLTNFLF